jgi:REP element-mobilizing transposase RayT
MQVLSPTRGFHLGTSPALQFSSFQEETGMGHANRKSNKQLSLAKSAKHDWKFRYNHGGALRKKRKGRFARSLSTKTAIHLVFKAQRSNLRRGYRSPLGFYICNHVIKKYAKRFFVSISEQAICNDHIHLIVRFSKRSLGQHFLRVVAGQIAQQLEKNGFLVTDTQSIWKYRPFSRVVKGWAASLWVTDYVRLNEMEASGKIKYSKQRLKGLSAGEWGILWS